MLWRRRVLAAALSLMAAVGGLFVAGTAEAQKVSTGSLSFSGDQGDYITQGDSYAYSTGDGDGLNVSSSTGSMVSISVNAYNGDWWTLTFDAPGTQVLGARTYSAAHRYPFNGTGPGLELSGEGRGCNELTGSFTISKAVFGSGGYVQAFDATFEQHCEGGDPAARGKIHIANPSPPRESGSGNAVTTSPRSATTRPRVATTKPRATPTGRPRATASSRPSAAPTGGPGATSAGSGTLTATNTSVIRALLRDGAFVWRALIAVAIIALVGLVALALVGVGVVKHVRGR